MMESEMYEAESADSEEEVWDYRRESTSACPPSYYTSWKGRVQALQDLCEDSASLSSAELVRRAAEGEEDETSLWDLPHCGPKRALQREESSGYCSLREESPDSPAHSPVLRPPPPRPSSPVSQCVLCSAWERETVRGSCGHSTCLACGRAWVGAAVVAGRRRLGCPACLAGRVSEWEAYALLHEEAGLRRCVERRALHRVFGEHPGPADCAPATCPYAALLQAQGRLEALAEVLRSSRRAMQEALGRPLWEFRGEEPPTNSSTPTLKRPHGKARWRTVVQEHRWV